MLNDDYFYLKIINAVLSNRSSQNLKPCVQDIELIEKLCNEVRKKISFDKVVHFDNDDNNRFSISINYEFIKILLYFDVTFEIIQDQNFYLESLEFVNMTGNQGQDKTELFEHSKYRVDDENLFNKKVIENINSKRLTYSVQRDHLIYAIDNNLIETFEKIGSDILEDKFLFDQSDILVNYIEKLDDPADFLRKCCYDTKSALCWSAVKLLKEKKLDNDFILEIAEQYLKFEDYNYLEKAVNIFFYLNKSNALLKYDFVIDKFLESDDFGGSGFNPNDVISYTHTSELDLYEGLFNKIFIETSGAGYYLHYSRAFMQTFTALISKYDDGYSQIKKILLKLKNEIQSESNRAFYVNTLLEICENAYLKEKSPEKSFEEVLEILK